MIIDESGFNNHAIIPSDSLLNPVWDINNMGLIFTGN